MSSNTSRRSAAHQVRVSAADIAHNREHPEHVSNGDELRHRGKDGKPSYIATFTKGLPHDEKTGLVAEPNDVQLLIDGIDSGNPRDFRDTPLGDAKNVGERVLKPSEFRWKSDKAQTSGKDGKHVGVRAWESQGAGNTFDLEGPDAQAVTMPPAPALGSDELTAEMAEVYAQALLRDVPFTTLMCDPIGSKTEINKVDSVLEKLNALAWFSKDDCCRPTFERARSRGELSPHNAFRGITPGDNVGPYISQFLLAGNVGLGKAHEAKDGMIAYGAIRVDQRVRTAKPREDYMTTWNEWLDVQNGAKLGGLESYLNITKNESGFRFITTPRDLATYVHYDALYEAYLNACLIMLGLEIPFDPGLPFGDDDARDHQQGFAHFGGPHILSLVTEVATRALKAVRFQKFNIHRRCRPEVLAARMELATALKKDSPEIGKMFKDLDACGILDMVKTRNDQNNGKKGTAKDKNRYLLPMAFCEGSPM
ncbi:MAG: bromoperoxidase, partial [Pseudomonadota bacterium]